MGYTVINKEKLQTNHAIAIKEPVKQGIWIKENQKRPKLQRTSWRYTKIRWRHEAATITQRRNRELASVDVNAKCRNEDSVDAKEKEGVDKYGLDIGGETAKFDVVGVPGELE